MSKKVLYEGPDISGNQGNVNIKAIRDAGYGRVGIRAGYGRDNTDEKFDANAEACYNLGMPVLLYWFSYAYTAELAAEEGMDAVAHARKYWKRCPIAFDFEYDSVNFARKKGVNVTKDLATDLAVAFLKTVREAGYIPVLYANEDYLKNYFDMDRIAGELGSVYVWFARYSSGLSDGELAIADVWQYSSDGQIAGIFGRVDLNRFYTDFGAEADVRADRETPVNINVLNFQKAVNADGYRDQSGVPLIEDGKNGPRTRYVCGQINLKARQTATGYLAGSTGYLVRWVQERLKEMGYDVDVDGRYGPATRRAVLRFQKEHGLAEDGVAGYNTIQALFYA